MIERVSAQGGSYSTRTTALDNVETQTNNSKNNSNHEEKAFTNSSENKKKKLDKIVEGMNEFLQPSNTSLKFELHDKLNEYYVTIVDDTTHEVIKEIPSKKMLDIYAAMTDFVGLLVDKKI
ncbi:flagellar protein FlaG [Peribacillus glennii]|uniref:Flagellar protein FlaG n=1 Tax=Peribacillus glennii TaxID=2303991 RepID=A0A372LD69_9BACI|nr:flagellar protein FlaG [Peribacillus glennii]RFU63942.1 flagellar protein FlaG [Peribacillus glennii]